jgi:hypothetical protein
LHRFDINNRENLYLNILCFDGHTRGYFFKLQLKIRKMISDKLRLPLSIFCLGTYHNKQRLYDQMKLMNYVLKIHDHIYFIVWSRYEK